MTCMGLPGLKKPVLVQAGSGVQGGDEQDRMFVELLGAGCFSAPTCGTGEWAQAWHRAQAVIGLVCCTFRLGKVKCWA